MKNKLTKEKTKTENSSKILSQVFPDAQGNNFLFSFSSSSKSSSQNKNNIRKEKQDSSIFINPPRYIHLQNYKKIDQNSSRKTPINTYNLNQYRRYTEKKDNHQKSYQEKSFQPMQRNTNHNVYTSDISKNKNQEQEKKYSYRSNYSLTQPSQRKTNERKNTHDINHRTSNIHNTTNNNINNTFTNRYNNDNKSNYSNNDRKTSINIIITQRNNKDKKINDSLNQKENTNKSYQQDKNPPKYYRNNPLISNKYNKQNLEKKDENILQPVAQKICNIIIKGGNTNKKEEKPEIPFKNARYNNSKLYVYQSDKKKKEIESEDENDTQLNKFNNEKEMESEENNNNEDKEIKIQRAQKIEKIRDKNNIFNKKNNNINLKIEKLDSNFELKKNPFGYKIAMQKAQSFEQPRNFVSKPKKENKKFEVSQLKNCDIELIGRGSLAIENKTNIQYDNQKKDYTKYQTKKKNKYERYDFSY